MFGIFSILLGYPIIWYDALHGITSPISNNKLLKTQEIKKFDYYIWARKRYKDKSILECKLKVWSIKKKNFDKIA